MAAASSCPSTRFYYLTALLLLLSVAARPAIGARPLTPTIQSAAGHAGATTSLAKKNLSPPTVPTSDSTSKNIVPAAGKQHAASTTPLSATPTVPSNDRKQPDCEQGGIPFLGAFLPGTVAMPQQPPVLGNPYGGGSGSAGRHYLPGLDDTFLPNPGFEVPLPGAGSGDGSP